MPFGTHIPNVYIIWLQTTWRWVYICLFLRLSGTFLYIRSVATKMFVSRWRVIIRKWKSENATCEVKLFVQIGLLDYMKDRVCMFWGYVIGDWRIVILKQDPILPNVGSTNRSCPTMNGHIGSPSRMQVVVVCLRTSGSSRCRDINFECIHWK